MRHLILVFTLALTLALPLTLQAQDAPPDGATPAPAAVEVVSPVAPDPSSLALTPSPAPAPEVAIPVEAVPVPAVDPLAPAKEAAAAAVAETPAVPPTTEELLATGSVALREVVKTVQAERDAEGVQWIAWFGALAAMFTLLLGLCRKWGSILLNKQWLRVASLGLGLLAGLFGYLSLGAPDWAVLLLGLSGPGSMLVYAVLDLVRPGAWAKAKARAAEKAADAAAGR